MNEPSERPSEGGFWNKLVRFLVEVIRWVEELAGPGNGRRKKRRALEAVDRWYRASGIRIRYLPRPLERWVIRRIASGLIDALVDLLRSMEAPEKP